MCELLVRVKDKSADPDPARDAMMSKRGHVIACQPDGWPWSQAERTNPDWIIVKMPGVDPNDYAAMTRPVTKVAVLPSDGAAVVARRAFSLDMAKVPQLAIASGASRAADATVSRESFDAARLATQVKADFEVIG